MGKLPDNNPKNKKTLRKQAEKLFKEGRELEAIRMMDEEVGDRTRAWELRKTLLSKELPANKSKVRSSLTELFVTPGRPTLQDKIQINNIIAQKGDTILFDLVMANRSAVEEAKRALKSGEINGRTIGHMSRKDKISHIIKELRTRYPINDEVFKYLSDSDTIVPDPSAFKKRAGKNLKIHPELAKSRITPGYNVKINGRYYHALSKNMVIDLQNGRPMRLNDVIDRIPIPERGRLDIKKEIVPETDRKAFTSKDRYKIRTLERRHRAILSDQYREAAIRKRKNSIKMHAGYRSMILDTESMVVEQTSRSNLLSVGLKTMDFKYDPDTGRVVQDSKLKTFIPVENFELDTISAQQIEKAQVKVKDEIRHSNRTMHKYLQSMLEDEDVGDILKAFLQKRESLNQLINNENATPREISEAITKTNEDLKQLKRTVKFTHEGLSTGLKGSDAAPVEVTFGSMGIPSHKLSKSDYAAVIQDMLDTATHGVYAFNSEFDMAQLDEIKVRLPKEGIKDIRGLSIMKMRELFSDIGPLNSDAMFRLFKKPAEKAADVLGLSNMDRIDFMKSFQKDVGAFTSGMDVETLYRFVADDPRFFERHIEYLDPEVEKALADHVTGGKIKFGDVKSLKSYKETLPVFDDQGYLSIDKLKNLNRKKLSPKARKMKSRLYSDLASRWVKMRSLKWIYQNDYELRRTSNLLEDLVVEETGKTENAVKINRDQLRERNVRKYADSLIENKRGLTRGSYYEIMSGILDEYYTALQKGHRINETTIEKNVAFFTENNFKGGFSDKIKGRMLTDRPIGGAFKTMGAMALLSVGVSALTRLTTTFGEGDETVGTDPDRRIEGLRHDSMITIVNRLFNTDFGSGRTFWNRTFNVIKNGMESLVESTALKKTYMDSLTGLNNWINKTRPITPLGRMVKSDSQTFIHNLHESASKLNASKITPEDVSAGLYNKITNMSNAVMDGFDSMSSIAKKHRTGTALGVGGVVLMSASSSYDPPDPDPRMGPGRGLTEGPWESFKSRFTMASESRHRHTDFGSGQFDKAVRAGRYALKYLQKGAYTRTDMMPILETFFGYQYHRVPKEIAKLSKDKFIMGSPTSSFGKRAFVEGDRIFTSLASKADDAALMRESKHIPASDIVRYNKDIVDLPESIMVDMTKSQTPYMYAAQTDNHFLRVNSAKSTIEKVATRPQNTVDVIEEKISPGWKRLVGETTDNGNIMNDVVSRRVVKNVQNVYRQRGNSTVLTPKAQRLPTLPRSNVMNASKGQPEFFRANLRGNIRELFTEETDNIVSKYVGRQPTGKPVKFKGVTSAEALDDQMKAYLYQYKHKLTDMSAFPRVEPLKMKTINSNIYAADKPFVNDMFKAEKQFTRTSLGF